MTDVRAASPAFSATKRSEQDQESREGGVQHPIEAELLRAERDEDL